VDIEGAVLSWDYAALVAEWTLENVDTTRHDDDAEGPGLCVDDKGLGPGICDSPEVVATVAEILRWQAAGLRGSRPEGTGFKFYFRTAATSEALALETWVGPYDSFNDTLGELVVNLTNAMEREGIADNLCRLQIRVKIMQ